MDDCEKTTRKHILPYRFDVLPGRRIRIVSTTGAEMTYHENQIKRRLEGQDATLMRDLSSHERIMLETAQAILKENTTTSGLVLKASL